MRFLLDADLPRSAAEIFRRAGYEAQDVRDVGLRTARDEEIAEYARQAGFCLVTGDFDFADLRMYPPERYSGILVLAIPATATARYVLDLLGEVVRSEPILRRLPGHLAIVEPGRVRIRGGLTG